MAQQAYRKKVFVAMPGDAEWVELPANTASLSDGGTILDNTLLGMDTRSRLLGLREWSGSATLLFEPGNEAYQLVRQAMFNRSKFYFQYLPVGEIDSGYQGLVVVETFNHSGGVDELETVELSVQSSGALQAASPTPPSA